MRRANNGKAGASTLLVKGRFDAKTDPLTPDDLTGAERIEAETLATEQIARARAPGRDVL